MEDQKMDEVKNEDKHECCSHSDKKCCGFKCHCSKCGCSCFRHGGLHILIKLIIIAVIFSIGFSLGSMNNRFEGGRYYRHGGYWQNSRSWQGSGIIPLTNKISGTATTTK